jgi:uncharacterized protein involved in outer membrane biogenesis
LLARLRPYLFKTPVLVAVGLFAAWLLFGWFGFGPLAKWGAEKFVADKTGHHLVMDTPRFDPLGLTLTLDNLRLTEPDGKLLAGFKQLYVDFSASSLFHWAWIFDDIRLVQPEGNLALLPGGKLNWTPFIDAIKSRNEEESSTIPRLLIRRFELSGGQFDFADHTLQPTFTAVFKPLDLNLEDLSTLPDDKGAYQIATRTVLGARLRWQGTVELNPVAVVGTVAVDDVRLARLTPYLRGRIDVAPPAGLLDVATRYRLTYAAKQLGLKLDDLALNLDGFKLHGSKPDGAAVDVDRFAVKGGRFDLASRTVDLGQVSLSGGQVALTRLADGRLDVQDWLPPAAPKPAQAGTGKAPPAKAVPWTIRLGSFALDKMAIHYRDQTFVAPLGADLAGLRVGFKADARVGGRQSQFRLSDGEIGSGKLSVVSGSAPVLDLDAIRAEGASLDLAAHRAGVKLVALDGGQLSAERAPDGNLPLLAAFKPKQAAKAKPAATTSKAAGEPGWSWTLDQTQLNHFRVVALDRSLKPAAGLTLDDIDASVTGFSQDLKASVPVKLALKVKEGGSLKAEGTLVPAKGTLDARLDLTDLNLTPAQPYLTQFANATLRSGRASSRGRLTVGTKTRYQGSFRVADLRINESRTGERLLAWRNLSTEKLSATPDALNIDELKLDGLGGKLVIHKDRSTNLQDVLKPRPAASAKAQAKPAGKAAKPGFRLAIDRVNLRNGELDFADESLALPFGARIHGLKGYVNGITGQAGSPAQIELDGLVDDYGLARAAGQMDFLNPTGYTDIKVVFRNVEMTRLTPYSATFAGRKINSGKLSLDLEYKIKDRQLEGENKIVMDRLTLGERVESPTAKDLPLDLAIAILQDSDGVIDLGLPVSGSLDDPQFSYGRIIWKAFTNVIGKIVTAPFRALGRLFGGSGEKLEAVVFDAGEPGLLPPEQEKLKQVAQILAKRPRLALTVQGGWSPEVDGLAIRERQLRRALAELMGRKLAPGEDPGPLTLAQPATRDAVEKLYAARFGRDALNTFEAKYGQANPEPQPTSAAGRLLSRFSGLFKGKEAPLSADEAARLKGADLHELLYRQLVAKEPVTDAQLLTLGKARGDAMLAALAADGVPADRLTGKAPAAMAGVTGQTVPIKLGLGVAAQPAQPAAPAPMLQPAH